LYSHVGELAALATALCWSVSAVAFQSASIRIGSMVVNWIRLVFGLVFLTILGAVLRGRLLPEAPAAVWGWLGLSGLIGFVIGDLALFRAFVLIGARLSMLVMCLAPPVTAILGWLLLGERLSSVQVAGMGLTMVGVAWTVIERGPEVPSGSPGSRRAGSGRLAGVLLAGIGAMGQAGGLICSKLGMMTLADPFAATQIRVMAGICGFSVLFFVMGWWGQVRASRRDLKALGTTLVGSFFGPFLGVSLSLLAVQQTRSGVAAALMALVPVLMVPVAILVFRERVSVRAVLGTLVAVAGVILLFR